MIGSVRDVYGQISIHATADEEHEAVLDLLVLVMFVDGTVREGETDEIEAIVADYGWENERFSVRQHLGPAAARVRAAVGAKEVDAFLADIDRRIVNTVLRAAVHAVARDVADADGSRSAEEDRLLGQISQRFP